MTRLFTFLVLMCAFIITPASKAHADEVQRINTNEMFDRAWNNHFTNKGLEIADSLYKEGVRRGDITTQCRALSAKLVYYFSFGKTENIEKTAEQLIKLSRRETRLNPYYYFAQFYVADNYLYHRSTIKTMKVIHDMEEMLKRDKLRFGRHCVDLLNGMVYAHNGEFSKAIEKADQALRNAEDWADSLRVYSYKSAFYMDKEDYENVVIYSDKALKLSRYDSQKFIALHHKCLSLYLSGRFMECKQTFQSFMQVVKKMNNYKANAVTQARVYNHLANGEYDLAEKLVNTLDDSYLFDKIETMKAQGKYGEALNLFMKQIRYQDALLTYDTNQDINEFDSLSRNSYKEKMLELANERTRQLQQENMKLEQINRELQLAQEEARRDLEKTNKRSELADLEKTFAKKQKEKNDLLKQNNEEEENRLRDQHLRNVLIVTAGALLLALIMLAIYLYHKYNVEKSIEKKNKELAEAYQLAEESAKKKKTFLKVISHEIRTPINAIVGFTDIITMPGVELEGDELRDMKDRIRMNKLHLKTLMGDILDTKALETGNIEMNIEDIKVNDLCRSTLSMIQAPCKAKGIKLSFTSDVDDNYTIKTDEQRLQQVLINYLSNAEKNTTSGQINLIFSSKEEDEWVKFSVEDTGCGVPEDKADTIFERFEKVNLFVQGTGMGLYMCRLIAKRLGGKAEFDPSYKKGARFLFRLKKAMMLLVMLTTMFAASSAQTASQQDLQRLYYKAMEAIQKPECLKMADDVFAMAGRMNDADMQCKALYIPVAYYQNTGNDAEMHKSCNRMKDFAQKHNKSYYYYLAWYASINRLFIQSKTADALTQLNDMRKQAYKENNEYGLARYHRAVANIYERNGKYTMAIKKFRDELKEMDKAKNKIAEFDPGDTYERIGACQKYLGNYKEAAATFDKAMKLSKQHKTKMENKAWRAIVAFMLNDRGLFLKYYKELIKDPLAMQTMSQNIVRQVNMFYHISQNQWNKAFEICNVENPKAMDYMLLSDFYYFQGDTMKALEMNERRFAAEQRRETDKQRRDLVNQLTQIAKELVDIKEQIAKDEQETADKIQQRLEAEKKKMELYTANAKRQKDSVLMKSNELEEKERMNLLNQAQAKLKIEQAQREQEAIKEQHRVIILEVMILLFVLLLIFILYIIRLRRKKLKDLEEKNRELQEALEKVHEADRLKETFLKQMDEDVREPLFSLTTYTRKIIDDTYINDEEGKMKAKEIVAENAQHVLEIVTEAVEKAMD